MRKQVISRVTQAASAALLAGSLLTSCLPGSSSDSVSIQEAENALRGVKGLVEESKGKKLPVSLDNPKARIQLAKDVYIHLPKNRYTEGKQVVPGLAVFGGENHSTSAVQMTKKETRLLNIVADEQAPEDFEYKLDMPEYYKAMVVEPGVGDRLGKQGDPNVLAIYDTRPEPEKDPKLVYAFPIPWAKDAKGRKVATSYHSSDGRSIVQNVRHKNGGFRQDLRGKGYAYPIVADPLIIDQRWYYTIVKFNAQETYDIYRGGDAAVIVLGWLVPVAIALGLNVWRLEGIVNSGQCLYLKTGWDAGYYGGAC
ncbi:hypothetical protein [Streptomyces prunicolor]|uniref:hypothetical protein n=1 Tax=Streptomyces prunicolor TaxID=67348 RepID=UPI00340650AB